MRESTVTMGVGSKKYARPDPIVIGWHDDRSVAPVTYEAIQEFLSLAPSYGVSVVDYDASKKGVYGWPVDIELSWALLNC